MKRLLLLVAVIALPRVVSAQTAETIEYYGHDAIGSIRIVWDANGNVLGRQDYAPFGKPLFAIPAMPKEEFGAQEKDDETNQSYFHARMFETRTGRFTRSDPIGAGLLEPQGWRPPSVPVHAEDATDTDPGAADHIHKQLPRNLTNKHAGTHTVSEGDRQRDGLHRSYIAVSYALASCPDDAQDPGCTGGLWNWGYRPGT